MFLQHSQQVQDVVRVIPKHLHWTDLALPSPVLMCASGVLLEHPTEPKTCCLMTLQKIIHLCFSIYFQSSPSSRGSKRSSQHIIRLPCLTAGYSLIGIRGHTFSPPNIDAQSDSATQMKQKLKNKCLFGQQPLSLW